MKLRTSLMRASVPLLLFACAPVSDAAGQAGPSAPGKDYPIRPVPFTAVRFTSGVLADRQETNRKVTLPFALQQCKNSGRLKNFDLAAETMRRRAAGEKDFQNKPASNLTFDDTDIYKYLEGAAYSLSTHPDADLLKETEAIIPHLQAAQEPDGYLYTFRTMHPLSPAHPWVGQNRWEKETDLSHELYNLGHFFEFATAYYQATGNRVPIDMAVKAADLLCKEFGRKDSPNIAPGHQVVEMGLAKLYRMTGKRQYLELARRFLDNKAKDRPGKEYDQSHKPVLQQDEVVGHAVRANYMYAGMADVAALSGDKRYEKAIEVLWDNLVGKKLHLTGGCGGRFNGEAYGANYELPSFCYNETCAAIGFLYWTHRMFLLSGEAKCMDVFERALYNGAFSGVSLSGDRFFYPNPLEFDGKAKFNHGNAGRAPWFECSCCPQNIMRLIASMGGCVYAEDGPKLFVNLYASSKAEWNGAEISQETNYPWDGRIGISLKMKNPATFTLALRIPEWVRGRPLPSDLYVYENDEPAKWSVAVNGTPVKEPMMKNGYALLEREWKSGDTVELNLPMPIRRVKANPDVQALKGQVAFERGPIVFAFEGIDQQTALPWNQWGVSSKAKVSANFQKDLLGGVETIRIEDGENVFTGIPYACWANRGQTPMRVWLDDTDVKK